MTFPRATYRLQLHADFTLRDAANVVPILHRMGISHLYLSPVSQARAGSEHGYDVTDPGRISDALGGADAMQALAAVLAQHGMGVLLDIVPNHMAASTENDWWADLLLNGASSAHARTFDTPLASGNPEPLLLPVLGAPADEVVAAGELQITERDGRGVLQYHDQWFPLPDSVAGHERVTAQLLASLPYTLADWRTVQEETGYRRFFDVTGLVGVRVEDPAVFERTHAGILQWLRNGWVQGLRIDHIDGLRDPAGYLRMLGDATSRSGERERPYTVVEKILAPDEWLPPDWQMDGTTGYEMMRVASSFLVDPGGYRTLEDLFRRLTGTTRQFDDVVHASKLEVLDRLFTAELRDVAGSIADIIGVAHDDCVRVMRELTASLGVYRTYVNAEGASAIDRLRVDAARAAARERLDAGDQQVLDRVCRTLLLDETQTSARDRDRALDATARWQQLSGPVMAKGFEDTALYRWPVLLAVNDVGGEPGRFMNADEVNDFFVQRAANAPGALNATSTHDSKRSGDMRARLLVLSERAHEWVASVERWLPFPGGSDVAITRRDELTLLQTLVGAWPLDGPPDEEFVTRVQQYMRKAAREAKRETDWLEPDEAYERALLALVERVLTSSELATVRKELQAFVERIALHGAINALAQVVLKCAAPGVPDTYQGTARWRFDLVDPDNRRPVDYDELAAFISQLESIVAQPDAVTVSRLRDDWRDGRIKLYVHMALLHARRRCNAFEGSHEPLAVSGARAANLLAFRRAGDDAAVIAIVPRWPRQLAPAHSWPTGAAWGDTTIETGPGRWRNVLDGARHTARDGRVRLADALAVLPVALLEME